MKEFKAHCQYVHEYLIQSESRNRQINAFLAIASSSSIGGWVIWKDYAFVWAAIIATSQVLNALKPYLPFNQRIKPLRALTYDFDQLFIELESDWFHIVKGNLTEEEIHQKVIDFKRKKSDLWKKHMAEVSIPHKKDLHALSETIAQKYFENNY